MKIISIYTDATRTLKDEWFLKTLRDRCEVKLVHLPLSGSGDDRSAEWYACITEKIVLLIDQIRRHWLDSIIWADIDIQFFRRTVPLVRRTLREYDLAFQACGPDKKTAGTGFMGIRCNEPTLSFFERILERGFAGRPFADQDTANEVLAAGDIPLKWTLFPETVYNARLGPLPRRPVLHHACAASPQERNGRRLGSLDLKTLQMLEIRRTHEAARPLARLRRRLPF